MVQCRCQPPELRHAYRLLQWFIFLGTDVLCVDSRTADRFRLLAHSEFSQQHMLVCLVRLVFQSFIRPSERSTQHLNFSLISACAQPSPSSSKISALIGLVWKFDPFFSITSGVEVRRHEHEFHLVLPRLLLALQLMATQANKSVLCLKKTHRGVRTSDLHAPSSRGRHTLRSSTFASSHELHSNIRKCLNPCSPFHLFFL